MGELEGGEGEEERAATKESAKPSFIDLPRLLVGLLVGLLGAGRGAGKILRSPSTLSTVSFMDNLSSVRPAFLQ